MNAGSPAKEQLRLVRLGMVVATMAPLFLLWAIRGTCLMPGWVFMGSCLLLVIIPHLLLILRVRQAIRSTDQRSMHISRYQDNRDHLLVYLFAMLTPFYADQLETWRSLIAAGTAVLMIIFLFWYMNLHYINILVAILGYRIFEVFDDQTGSKQSVFTVISKRRILPTNATLKLVRISDSVYLEWS